jgi:hypothetical protein
LVRNQAVMSELLQFIIVAAFGTFCFGCAYFIAFIVTRNKWRDEMIKRGVARYTRRPANGNGESRRRNRDIECPPAASRRRGRARGGGPISQYQAPIVQTMFHRCLPYCRVEFDACLASCPTSSISAHGGKLDRKEAFGRHEIAVCKMQSRPGGFQSGNSSDHSRVLSVTFSCRLFIGVLAGGKHTLKVRGNGNFSHRQIRRVFRTEFVLLCE